MRAVGLLSFAALACGPLYEDSSRPPAAPYESAKQDAPAASPLQGWVVAGAGHGAYCASVDRNVTRQGHATIEFSAARDPAGAYGTYMTSLDATTLRRHRVRASMFVRTQGVTARGDAWVRARADGAPGDGPGLVTISRSLVPDADFIRYEMVLGVPDEATRLEIGVGIAGPGKLWMDGVRVEMADDAGGVSPRGTGETEVDGWVLSGGARNEYAIFRDARAPYAGRASIALVPRVDPRGRYGTVVHSFDAAPLRGKRVRAAAWVRTEGVTVRGDFWVRAQGATSPGDGPGLGGGTRQLAPTSDFTRYDVDFWVPQEATEMQVGAGIAGPGKLWIEGASIDVVDARDL